MRQRRMPLLLDRLGRFWLATSLVKNAQAGRAQPRCVEAVSSAFDGSKSQLLFQLPPRVRREKRLHLPLVFGREDAASGVDEFAAGFHEAAVVAKQFGLESAEVIQLFG